MTDFIDGVRKQISEELGTAFQDSNEINTEEKATEALRVLIEWKLAKASIKKAGDAMDKCS